MAECVMIGKATIIHGDAYEVLRQIDLEQIGLLLTDPMYGMGANTKGKTTGRGAHRLGGTVVDNADWLIDDDVRAFDPRPFLPFGKIVLWGGNHFAHLLPPSPRWIVWDKRDGAPPDDNSDAELAWTNLPGKAVRVYRQMWRGVCRAGRENLSRSGAKLHPFQKPVALGKFCIVRARLAPGECVFDPFAGSGSFGVAALELGHPVVMVEKERRYFEVCVARAEAAARQIPFEIMEV